MGLLCAVGLFVFVVLLNVDRRGSLSFPRARAGESSTPTITIGFIPGAGASDLKANGDELASLLQKRTGFRVQSYVGSSYGDLIDKMSEKKVDFAFLSALSLVELEQKTPVKVLLKKVWEHGYYHSVWLTPKKSPIHKLKDLRGKRVAFVDEKSASGYLYPVMALREQGIDFRKDLKKYVFSGSHDHSVELLRNREVDAIAVFSDDAAGRASAWNRGNKNSSSAKASDLRDVRVVWSSVAIPNDPFCVRSDFYERDPKATHDLMFALIEMDSDPTTGADLKKLLGVTGLMLATSQQYEPVREMFRALKVGTVKDAL